jgi:hypothetical protein
MSPINRTDSSFSFVPGDPPITADGQYPPSPPTPAPGQAVELGPLAALVGEWEGEGFNTIWRPHFPSDESDRFLELNLTTEKLVFSPINGEIPNRGLLQKDIVMFGVTYLQQISRRGEPNAGLHIEPGIWAVVPQTADPAEPPSVVRMASIPHGTVINAQGAALVSKGPPPIAGNNIIPFPIGGTPPPSSDFPSAEAEFTQLSLATPNEFREPADGTAQNGIDQAMVENPNSVLGEALASLKVKETTTLHVLTADPSIVDGGTANTAFLQGGNANASAVEATFWIETLEGDGGMQLQYTQTVMLDFNGLRWPHVTVATLKKMPPASAPA